MLCQWYVRGGGEGKRRILIGQSVPPTPFGMAFGSLKVVTSGNSFFSNESQELFYLGCETVLMDIKMGLRLLKFSL
jgi:hypothetical protein